MGNIGAQKMFALVVDSATGAPRRLIDTSDDKDDAYLLEAEKHLAADEVMYKLLIEDYPVRKPYIVAEAVTGYKQPVIVVKDPDEATAAKAEIESIKASINLDSNGDFFARVKEVLSEGNLPRNDQKVRQLLAAEMARVGQDGIAAALLTDAPEAPFYVASVVESLLPQIEANLAVAVVLP